MDTSVESFFASAQSIRLTSVEKRDALSAVFAQFERESVRVDDSVRLGDQMDSALTSFFAAAQSIGLTPDEKRAIAGELAGSVGFAHIPVSEDATSHTLRSAESIVLNTEEKDEMFSRLQSFMSDHPVKAAGSEQEESAGFMDRFSQFLFVLKPLTVSFAALVLVCAGGVTSYAAESALPGDFLYPIKIYVNEAVQTSLAMSPESRARVDAKLAERRLQEAEGLAARNELSPVVRDQLLRRFAMHVASAEEDRREVGRNEGSTKEQALRKEFEDTVRARQSALLSIPSDDQAQLQTQLQMILTTVASSASETAAKAVSSEIPAVARGDAELRIASANERIAQTRAVIRTKDESKVARSLTLVNAAYDALLTAQGHLKDGNYALAEATAKSALDLAIQAQALVEAESVAGSGSSVSVAASSVDSSDVRQAQSAMSDAERAIADVRGYISAQSSNLTPQALASVTELLQNADTRYASAKARYTAKQYAEAAEDAYAALSLAGDARAALQSSLRGGLGTRVETEIPVDDAVTLP